MFSLEITHFEEKVLESKEFFVLKFTFSVFQYSLRLGFISEVEIYLTMNFRSLMFFWIL